MQRKWSVAIEISVQDALAVGVRYPYLANLPGSRRGQAFRARPLSESLSQLSLVKPGKAMQTKKHMTRWKTSLKCTDLMQVNPPAYSIDLCIDVVIFANITL